jgi:hypothetical protein
METTTETNQANRELTTTEIKIAIAQIEDRLMRVAKAQSELSEIPECDEECDEGCEFSAKIDEFSAKLRVKYEIPELVHLFFPVEDGALTRSDVTTCKPHLASFVKGKLTENAMSDLIFFFEECAECDYGWILVERPMGFYNDQTTADHIDDVRREIESIGTRSPSKNTKLQKIAGAFSAK